MRLRRPKSSSRLPRNSYYQGGKSSAPTPFKKRLPLKPRRLDQRLIDGLILLAAIFILVYSLIVNPKPWIVANSQAYHPESVYLAAAQAKMDGLSSRTKITFNEAKVINGLRKSFPEISSASVELPLFSQRPTLRLDISRPSFVLRNPSSSYILSADGVAVAPAAGSPASKNLPVIEDRSGYPVKSGTRVLSSDNVDFINVVLAQSKRAGVTVSELILPALAQELNLKAADKGYFVKFYLGGDPQIQTGQFLAARQDFAKTGKDPASYLDVRVTGKVYYK